MKKSVWQQIKTVFSEFLRSLYQLRNGELLTFLIFLVIATFIWFLHSTQSVTQSTITYPIHYKDIPGNITVSNKLLQSVQVTVQDKGGRLYAYYLKRKKNPLEIDLMALKSHNGIVSVPLSQFESKLYTNLKPSSRILRIQPDSLVVYYATNESKTVPVELISDISLQTQHMMTGKIDISPAMVNVYAPAEVLKSINSIKTKPLKLESLTDTTYTRVQLEPVDGLRYSHQEVDVRIPVEAFTECSFEVPVQGINFPEAYTLRSFPSKVNISFLIQESLYPQMRAEDFLIGVDYQELLQHPGGLIKPHVYASPQAVRRIIIKPQQVDCLIEEL